MQVLKLKIRTILIISFVNKELYLELSAATQTFLTEKQERNLLCYFFTVEQKAVLSGEEQERKITTYEEAMNKIKDTTGVSDIKEVVQRFLSQGETQKHLEQLKTNNEKMLARLKEEKVYSDHNQI